MRLLGKLNRHFGFTPSESKVLYFLILAFLAGSGVKLYKTYFPLHASPRFDYSEEEKEFAYRSSLIDSPDTSMVERPEASQAEGEQPSSESEQQRRKSTKKSEKAQVVNLNTATTEELMSLPGIGPALAERILAYRNAKGKFRNVEELKNVRGIGEKSFEKLRPYLKVE